MKLIIKNYKCHKNLTLNFKNNLILLNGVSGSGKSTVFQSIFFCFFGEIGNIQNVENHSKSETSVEIFLKNLRIHRTKNPKKLIVEQLEDSQTKSKRIFENEIAQQVINDYLGTETKEFFSQKILFSETTPQQKFNIFEKLANFQNEKFKNTVNEKILQLQKIIKEKEISFKTNEAVFKEQQKIEGSFLKKDYKKEIEENQKKYLKTQNNLKELRKKVEHQLFIQNKLNFLKNELNSLKKEIVDEKKLNNLRNELQKIQYQEIFLSKTEELKKNIEERNKIDIEALKIKLDKIFLKNNLFKKIDWKIDDSEKYEKILEEYLFLQKFINVDSLKNTIKNEEKNQKWIQKCPNCEKHINIKLDGTIESTTDTEICIFTKFIEKSFFQNLSKKSFDKFIQKNNISLEKIRENRKYKTEYSQINEDGIPSDIEKIIKKYYLIENNINELELFFKNNSPPSEIMNESSSNIKKEILIIEKNIEKNKFIQEKSNKIQKEILEIEQNSAKIISNNEIENLENLLEKINDEKEKIKEEEKNYLLQEKYFSWEKIFFNSKKDYEKSLEELNLFLILKELIHLTEIKIFEHILQTFNIHMNYFLQLFFNENISISLFFSEEDNWKKIQQTFFFQNSEFDVNKFSTGEIARINLAFNLSVSIFLNFPFLILDEKVVNLDQENATKIYSVIKNNFSEKQILTVAHNTVQGIFDEIINL